MTVAVVEEQVVLIGRIWNREEVVRSASNLKTPHEIISHHVLAIFFAAAGHGSVPIHAAWPDFGWIQLEISVVEGGRKRVVVSQREQVQ